MDDYCSGCSLAVVAILTAIDKANVCNVRTHMDSCRQVHHLITKIRTQADNVVAPSLSLMSSIGGASSILASVIQKQITSNKQKSRILVMVGR